MEDEFNESMPDELAARFAAYAPVTEPEAPIPTPETTEETPAEPVQALTEAEPTETTETSPETTGEAVKAEEPPADEKAELEERLQRQYWENREAKRLLKLKEQELEALRGNRVESEDETVARRAELLAQQMAQTNIIRTESMRVKNAIEKEYGNSATIIDAFAAVTGEGVPTVFLQALTEAAHGDEHKILHYLARNPDEIERITNLSPILQGAAISKIATKVNAPPPQSKAPPPIHPVGGSTKSADTATKDFVRDFDKLSKEERYRILDEQESKARSSRLH